MRRLRSLFEESPAEAEAAADTSSLGSGLLSGPRWSPEPLTGDWFGTRRWLADRGLTFGFNVVNTYQGVVDGGNEEDWDNGGSIYLESQFNTEQAGLWPGGFIDFRAEKLYGDFPNGEAGLFPAVNMLGLFPEPNEKSFVISKAMATQFVAPWLGFFIGRFDTLDGDTNNLLSGRGRTGFLNPQLAFSPNSILTTPYILNGVGSLALTPNPFSKRPRGPQPGVCRPTGESGREAASTAISSMSNTMRPNGAFRPSFSICPAARMFLSITTRANS